MTAKCEAHPNYPRPTTCAGCVRVAELAEAQRKKNDDAVAEVVSTKAREKAEQRRQAINDCLMCSSDGYVGGVVCHHSVNAMLSGKKGIEKVRQALREAQERSRNDNELPATES